MYRFRPKHHDVDKPVGYTKIHYRRRLRVLLKRITMMEIVEEVEDDWYAEVIL